MDALQNQLDLTSDSPEATVHIGRKLGEQLRGGEVIVLESDLGGGKTELTKGMAAGLGSDDVVTSPTFTIEQVYRGKTLSLHHYDFYRLGEAGLMGEEISEVLEDGAAVCVIEWPDAALERITHKSPVYITIQKDAASEMTRHLRVICPEDKSYVLEGLK